MPGSPSRYARSASTPGVVVALAALLTAAVYRQPLWPATWLDEGFVTNGAMTLATRYVYGTTELDGVRLVHPTLVANGPGVVVPTAIAMAVGGVGLAAARATAAVFMVACGLLAMQLARTLGGPTAGLATLVLLLTLPREGFVYLGRMAMGNVPALVYLFAGLFVWWRALDRASTARAVAAGALFGLAAITKAQWSLVLPPALAVAWLVHVRVLRRPDSRLFVAAGGGVVVLLAAWYASRAVIQGMPLFAVDLAHLRETARWNVLALAPGRDALGSAWYLIKTGVALVVVVALVYAARQVHARAADAARVVLPAAITAVWMAWYVAVSIGWPRYAFEGFAVSTLLAGPAVARDPMRWFAWPSLRLNGAGRWLAAAGAAALLVVVAAQSSNRLRDLLTPADVATSAFVAEAERLLPVDARIESWEWQLDVLLRRQVHHPDDIWVGRYTAQIFAGQPVRGAYDWRALEPDYLVDGPFSKFTGIYRRDLDAGCCTLLTAVGAYELYRVTDGQ